MTRLSAVDSWFDQHYLLLEISAAFALIGQPGGEVGIAWAEDASYLKSYQFIDIIGIELETNVGNVDRLIISLRRQCFVVFDAVVGAPPSS